MCLYRPDYIILYGEGVMTVISRDISMVVMLRKWGVGLEFV